MADEPFVDTHIHFWDKSVDGLRWAWLEPGFSFRKWTFDPVMDAPRYGPNEFRAEADGSELVGAVHVNCADPLPVPAMETAWIDTLAAATGWPQAQVGRCDLDAADAPATIAAEAVSPLFRGVRDPFSAKHLDATTAGPAMDALAAAGTSVEVRRHHDDFGVVDELAARWPTVTILLSHGCLPLDRTPDEFAAWSAAMRSLARRPNVACKISTVVGASQPEPSVDRVRGRGCWPASTPLAPTAACSGRTSRSTVRTARIPSWSISTGSRWLSDRARACGGPLGHGDPHVSDSTCQARASSRRAPTPS